MLKNIRPSQHVLRAVTNGGFQDSKLVGDFPNLGEVWFNPDSIANILSLSHVRKVCRVTMDMDTDLSMTIHRLDGTHMKFREHACGLYVFSPSASADAASDYTMLSTVADQKKLFTARDVSKADDARRLYRLLGRPSEAEFLKLLATHSLLNCTVTVADAKRATLIYGPDVAAIKGKTTRTAEAPRVPCFDPIPVPPHIREHYNDVVLCVDFFFVQGQPFIHTISRNLQFRTATPVPNRNHATILTELRAVLRLYASRGFQVRDILGDHEFECIRADLAPIQVEIVPADSHVGEVERSNRTVQERARACTHGLPFKRLPKLLITSMVKDVIRCLNMLPSHTGVSDSLSPQTIVTGDAPPDYNKLKLEFGSYVQLFDDVHPTNTLRSRTFGAIALTPTGNSQGDYHFLSLASGSRLSRHRWQELPIPESAIARVEALTLGEGQPLIQKGGLVVEWRPDHPVDPDEYDRDFAPPADPTDDVLDPQAYEPTAPEELAALAAPVVFPVDDPPAVHPIAPPLPPADADQGAPDDQHSVLADQENEEDEVETQHATDFPTDDESVVQEPQEFHDRDPDEDSADFPTNEDSVDFPANEGAPDQDEHRENQGALDPHDEDEDEQDEVDQGVPEARYNLRNRTNPSSESFRSAVDQPYNSKSYFPPRQLLYKDIFGYIMTQMDANSEFGVTLTQMSAKAGLKKHGQKAEEALMAEFSQLEDLEVYEPLDPSRLNRAQRKSALRAINLIKEKRCGRLKGRTVADGRPQKGMYDKTETASPTVSTDALMVSIIVDAFERRDVATADIAGDYLKAYMKDFTIMKFTGPSVNILCNMKPKYKDYVAIENGVKVIYVRLIKAIYGCVQSALLWYKMFYSYLKQLGFELNPYDPCVANKIINGKQCTIAWYVDDTKISHPDSEVVSDIIDKIEECFGK